MELLQNPVIEGILAAIILYPSLLKLKRLVFPAVDS